MHYTSIPKPYVGILVDSSEPAPLLSSHQSSWLWRQERALSDGISAINILSQVCNLQPLQSACLIISTKVHPAYQYRAEPSRDNPKKSSKLKCKVNRNKVQKRNVRIVIMKYGRRTARGAAPPLSIKNARKVDKVLNHAQRWALDAAPLATDLEAEASDDREPSAGN